MTTRDAHGQSQVTDEVSASGDGQLGATLAGSLLGGVVGGAALYATTNHLVLVGSIAGVGGLEGALGVWLGLSLALGAGFAYLAGPAIDVYVRAATGVTARIAPLRIVLTPIVRRSGLGTTAAGVGALYGLLAGVAVGLVGVPAVYGIDVPLWNPSVLAGYVLFGLVLGLGYGLTLEGTVPLPSVGFVTPTVSATVLAPVLGGAAGGAVVYAAQPLYLGFLGSIVGFGSPTQGFGIWMGLAFLLGLGFALLARGHAGRGNSTTAYGLVYGLVLAVFVGLLGVPAAVQAVTGVPFEFANVSAGALVGFVVYGLVLGSTFGKTVNRRPLRPTFLVGRSRATLVAGVVAGAAGAGLLYAATPGIYLVMLGGVVGSPTVTTGVAVWMAIALLLGAGFAAFPARRVERRDVHGQTGLKVGAVYALLVALPVGAVVVPAVISASTQWSLPSPHASGAVLGAYLLVGVVHGVTYGTVASDGRLTPRFLQGRLLPVVSGVALGGAAGAAVVYAATPATVYFAILGGIAGSPTFYVGLGVWFGVALLLGVLFVPLAARAVEYRVGVVRGLVVGAVYGAVVAGLVGAFAVPAVANSVGYSLPVPHTQPPVAGYFAYGLLFGATYGAVRKRTIVGEDLPTSTAVGSTGQRAVVFGSLFGGSVGGLVMHHSIGEVPIAMLYFGAFAGFPGSVSVGWGVWLGVSLVLGGLYAAVVGPRLSGYRRSLEAFVERDEDLEALLDDLIDRAPSTTTATVAGLGYGVLLAVTVGAIAFPLAVNSLTGFGLPLPTLQPFLLLSFVLYGVVTGIGYGVVKEF